MEILEAFGINGKILLGQIINFLILFYLLKRFAFKPFLKTLKERREIIRAGIEKEKEAKEQLRMIEAERERILREAQERAVVILKESERRGREREEEILARAEKEKEQVLAEAKKLGEMEIEKMKKDFYQKNLELTLALTEKILREKIDLKKDRELIKFFLTHKNEKNSNIN
jgi:F-type H+-transporting ATPase subunit b